MSSKFTLGVAAVGLTVVFGGSAAYQYGTVDDVTFTVNKLETKRQSDTEKYLVSATYENGEKEVFENTDALLHGKFNSSDVQLNELEIGSTYNATVYGWRVPFFSMYRNIVDVEKTETAVQSARPAPQKPQS